MSITVDDVNKVLKKILDPEILVSIVDLGLIYNVDVQSTENEKYNVNIKMTLTSPGCPYGPALVSKTHSDVSQLSGIKNVNVDLVWVPQWNPRKMASNDVKMKMGLLNIDDIGEEETSSSV